MSELLAVGISHKTAPVALRERVAVLDGRMPDFLEELTEDGEVREAAAISTCNRTEIYLVAGDQVAAETAVLARLARKAGIRPTELAGHLYSLRNCDAARHLYRVTAGLDSMVLGEAEIQGQVKRAYDTALAADATGPMLNRLFSAALATGKRVRTETAISASRVNISTVAVQLAREALGALAGQRVVVLGAGEMSELTARALADEGADLVFVASRRRERAEALARRHGGTVVGFDAFPDELVRAEMMVAATASPHPIVEHDPLGHVMAQRGHRPLLIVDIAVPRDVDALCADVPGVTLRDIDDLQAVVARNRGIRRAEALQAEGIVEEEIERFAGWLGTLEVIPTIAALRQHGEAIVDGVLAENEGRWESLTDADRARVEAVGKAIMSRLLHDPTLRMKEAADEKAHARLQTVRELFGLEDADESERPAPAAPAEVRALPRRAADRR